jgi:hypothetical protein
MTEQLHATATHHLPFFITPPGATDVLSVITAVLLVLAVFGFGILFLRLHTLPERVAHKSHKIQFEIVAILGLLALFTHMHIFWVAGLLLAFIDVPDFGGFLGRIAGSVEKMAGLKRGMGADDVLEADSATPPQADESVPSSTDGGEPPNAKELLSAVPSRKEFDHA